MNRGEKTAKGMGGYLHVRRGLMNIVRVELTVGIELSRDDIWGVGVAGGVDGSPGAGSQDHDSGGLSIVGKRLEIRCAVLGTRQSVDQGIA